MWLFLSAPQQMTFYTTSFFEKNIFGIYFPEYIL